MYSVVKIIMIHMSYIHSPSLVCISSTLSDIVLSLDKLSHLSIIQFFEIHINDAHFTDEETETQKG